MSKYFVLAAYKGGPDFDRDAQIRAVAPRYTMGSGFDFTTGERDHSFRFRDLAKAQQIVRKLRKMKGVRAKIVDEDGKTIRMPKAK